MAPWIPLYTYYQGCWYPTTSPITAEGAGYQFLCAPKMVDTEADPPKPPPPARPTLTAYARRRAREERRREWRVRGLLDVPLRQETYHGP